MDTEPRVNSFYDNVIEFTSVKRWSHLWAPGERKRKASSLSKDEILGVVCFCAGIELNIELTSEIIM